MNVLASVSTAGSNISSLLLTLEPKPINVARIYFVDIAPDKYPHLFMLFLFSYYLYWVRLNWATFIELLSCEYGQTCSLILLHNYLKEFFQLHSENRMVLILLENNWRINKEAILTIT